jgi:hypothetical protein
MLIGLGHLARVGKDAVGDYLVSYHGFKKTAFAESLKEACRVIFHLDDRHLHGELKEVMHPFWETTPRDILQRVGTEALRRGFDEDVWVKSAHLRIQRAPTTNWVLTDVRFPNESEAIKSWGGQVFRIDRAERPDLIATNQHASETSMDSYDGWDGVISNVGTLNELYAAARKAMGLSLPRQEPLL